MAKTLHIDAAAKQLTRSLFNNVPMEGWVIADNDSLEVLVRGTWSADKIQKFSGYDVAWREFHA